MKNRKLITALVVLVVLALGAMVVTSSVSEVNGNAGHTMPDGTTMRDEEMR